MPTVKVAGYVVNGNGTTYLSKLVTSESEARRIKAMWFARSGGSYNATIGNVMTDGTTSGAGAAAAKTFLQSQSIQQLKRAKVDTRRAVAMRT